MTNRYFEEVAAIEAEIAELQKRKKRFQERGRDTSITEDRIAELKARIPALRGTGKLVAEKYGRWM